MQQPKQQSQVQIFSLKLFSNFSKLYLRMQEKPDDGLNASDTETYVAPVSTTASAAAAAAASTGEEDSQVIPVRDFF